MTHKLTMYYQSCQSLKEVWAVNRFFPEATSDMLAAARRRARLHLATLHDEPSPCFRAWQAAIDRKRDRPAPHHYSLA